MPIPPPDECALFVNFVAGIIGEHILANDLDDQTATSIIDELVNSTSDDYAPDKEGWNAIILDVGADGVKIDREDIVRESFERFFSLVLDPRFREAVVLVANWLLEHEEVKFTVDIESTVVLATPTTGEYMDVSVVTGGVQLYKPGNMDYLLEIPIFSLALEE